MHSRGVLSGVRMTVRFFPSSSPSDRYSLSRFRSVLLRSSWWRCPCTAHLAYRTEAPRDNWSEFIENDKEITLTVSHQTKLKRRKKKRKMETAQFSMKYCDQIYLSLELNATHTAHNRTSAPRDTLAKCSAIARPYRTSIVNNNSNNDKTKIYRSRAVYHTLSWHTRGPSQTARNEESEWALIKPCKLDNVVLFVADNRTHGHNSFNTKDGRSNNVKYVHMNVCN